MTKIKINKHVYPYDPYIDLNNKKIDNKFISEKENINIENIQNIINSITYKKPIIKGDTVAEKILSIFQDENYAYGDPSIVEENREKWIAKFNYYIEKNEPIVFTILGFPFKIPVPLKTSRVNPDLGEVLALANVNKMMFYVKEVYNPGGQFVIFTEGAFGEMTGLSEMGTETWINYKKRIDYFIKELGFEYVKAEYLEKLENSVPGFDKLRNKKIKENKKLFEEKDEVFMRKFEVTFDSVKRLVYTKKYSDELLMDVYNDELVGDEISEEVLKIRKEIEEKAKESVFEYLSYLSTKDDLLSLETLYPGVITISVVPKPTRIGIHLINKNLKRLPYHTIPVFNNSKIKLEYLIDIKRDGKKYKAFYLNGDDDKEPFYYSEI